MRSVLRIRFPIYSRLWIIIVFCIALSGEVVHAANYNVGCDINLAARAQALIDAIDTANSTVANDTITLSANCLYVRRSSIMVRCSKEQADFRRSTTRASAGR